VSKWNIYNEPLSFMKIDYSTHFKMWETILKFQTIIKNKWQKINYHPTWQAFPPLFCQKTGTWHLLGGAGRV
jgi:pterin-4a-carbinolamine dehydratase